MSPLWDGIKVGLILCFLLGPLFFVLVQASVEQGFRAGAMVGLGIWVSDALFFVAVYFGLQWVSQVIEWPGFRQLLGTGGSLLLVLFGLGAMLRRPRYAGPDRATSQRHSTWANLFARGFLVNTINPFTVFFWLGLMSTFILRREWTPPESGLFFAGILGTIVLTDTAKVLLAKAIRRHLRYRHLLWFRRLSGAALIAFGIGLFVRSVWVA